MSKNLGLLTRGAFSPANLSYRLRGLKKAIENAGHQAFWVDLDGKNPLLELEKLDGTIGLDTDFFIEGRPFFEKTGHPHFDLSQQASFNRIRSLSPLVTWSFNCPNFAEYFEGKLSKCLYLPTCFEPEVFREEEKEIDVLVLGGIEDYKKIEVNWFSSYSFLDFGRLLELGKRCFEGSTFKNLATEMKALEFTKDKESFELDNVKAWAESVSSLKIAGSLKTVKMCIASDNPRTWKTFLTDHPFVKTPVINSIEEVLPLLKKAKYYLHLSRNMWQGDDVYALVAPFCGALPLLPEGHNLLETSLDLPFYKKETLENFEEWVRSLLKNKRLREEGVEALKNKISDYHTWNNRIDIILNSFKY